MRDIAEGLTKSLARDGRGGMTGPLDMGGYRITNTVPGVGDGDLATVAQMRNATKGDPGGNVMAVGLFSQMSGMVIPIGTDLVQTSGATRGLLIADGAMTDADVAGHPLAIVKTANGRYFRRDPRDIWIEQFGAVPVTAKEFDSSPAIRAAYNYVAFSANTSPFYGGTSRGGYKVQVGVGRFYLGSRVASIHVCTRFEGQGTGTEIGGAATIFDVEDDAFFVERYNTNNYTVISPATTGGDGTSFRGICFRYVGTNPARTSLDFNSCIVSKARVDVQECQFISFPGAGVRVLANSGVGGTLEGEASGCVIHHNLFDNCWAGFANEGADANIQSVENNTFGGCTWGLYARQFLSIRVVNNHFKGNGYLYYNAGKRYQLLFGQEAAGSTTAPGTNPAVWAYVEDGSAIPGYSPQWVSGGSYKAGGAILHDNANARTVFIGNYTESGQAMAVINAPALVIGGQFTLSPASTCASHYSEQGLNIFNQSFAGTLGGGGTSVGVVSDSNGMAIVSPQAPIGLRLRPQGKNFALGGGASDTNVAVQFTSYVTDTDFGRGSPVNDTTWFAKGFAFGNRVWATGSAPPTDGPHAAGERVYNDGLVTSIGAVDFWYCANAGTPGTWVAKA